MWRVSRGSLGLATGGVRLVWHALVIGGPWLYLPASAGVLAWWAGVPWWWGTLAAVVVGAFAAADTGKGFSLERFRREAQHRLEEGRARAKAVQVKREWPRMCERAGWVTPADLEKRRPVPSLRFTRTMGRRLLVAWRPPESVGPGEYGTHVEELRRVIGAHSADWRPVTADPGTLVGLFGLAELPEFVPAPVPGPVVGPVEAPLHGPEPQAVQQAHRFTLGVGTGGTEVTWNPLEAPHMVVCGATGGGKGSITRTLVAQALAHPVWEVTVIDGKEGGEYAWAEGRGAELSRQGVELANDTLGDLEFMLRERGGLLYAAGAEHWADLDADWALQLVVIDEVADLVLQRRDGDRDAEQARASFASRLNRLIAQGRAVGIHVVIALQRADATILSGFMRNNVAARVAVGSLDPNGVDMLFPDGQVDAALGYLDGTPGRAVALGLQRGHTTVAPLQVQYLRALDLSLPQLLRPATGEAA